MPCRLPAGAGRPQQDQRIHWRQACSTAGQHVGAEDQIVRIRGGGVADQVADHVGKPDDHLPIGRGGASGDLLSRPAPGGAGLLEEHATRPPGQLQPPADEIDGAAPQAWRKGFVEQAGRPDRVARIDPRAAAASRAGAVERVLQQEGLNLIDGPQHPQMPGPVDRAGDPGALARGEFEIVGMRIDLGVAAMRGTMAGIEAPVPRLQGGERVGLVRDQGLALLFDAADVFGILPLGMRAAAKSRRQTLAQHRLGRGDLLRAAILADGDPLPPEPFHLEVEIGHRLGLRRGPGLVGGGPCLPPPHAPVPRVRQAWKRAPVAARCASMPVSLSKRRRIVSQ